MGKRQTRRTISFRAEVFIRARDHAAYRGESLAAYVEEAVLWRLDRDGAAEVDRTTALQRLDGIEVDRLRHRAREAVERLREMGIDPFDQSPTF